MAVNAYAVFTPYQADPWTSPNATYAGPATDLAGRPLSPNTLIQVDEFSGGVEQTLNIGSQSTGAGAGRIAFDPFVLRRHLDDLSPRLLQVCASGTPFARIDLLLIKAPGSARRSLFAQYTFKLAAIKTIGSSAAGPLPVEEVSFEYGGYQVRYSIESPTGGPAVVVVGGWNRVRNISDTGNDNIQ